MLVVESLAAGFPPKEIHVRDAMLNVLLQPLGEELGFKIKKQSRLRAIDRAKREIQKFIGYRRLWA
jgi:hypothetical protein